jgi:hypothetical protein
MAVPDQVLPAQSMAGALDARYHRPLFSLEHPLGQLVSKPVLTSEMGIPLRIPLVAEAEPLTLAGRTTLSTANPPWLRKRRR